MSSSRLASSKRALQRGKTKSGEYFNSCAQGLVKWANFVKDTFDGACVLIDATFCGGSGSLLAVRPLVDFADVDSGEIIGSGVYRLHVG